MQKKLKEILIISIYKEFKLKSINILKNSTSVQEILMYELYEYF